MKRIVIFLVIIFSCVFSFDLSANDGIDRYAVRHANLLYYLYGPISGQAGFTVLEEDMKGGADGDTAFRWAQGHILAITKLVAYETCQEMGPAHYPMAIFDLAAENGDTPVSWKGDDPPQGRHPGGSHDGGFNLDFGYYMTSLKGLYDEPDYAVCDDHFSKTEKDEEGNPKDLYQCVGPANRLDVDRQAYFFFRLFSLHLHEFKGLLLENIGIDHYAKAAVMEKLRQWQKNGRYSIDEDFLREVGAILTCDRWGGWSHFHHHHIHVRFKDFDLEGEFRNVVKKIETRVRAFEYQLLIDENPEQKFFINAVLLSYKLSRSIEVTLNHPDLNIIDSCRYRIDDGPWAEPDSPEELFRYVFDLPNKPLLKDTSAMIEAELKTVDGTVHNVSSVVFLPAQSPLLRIKVHPETFTGVYLVEGTNSQQTWNMSLNFPSVYTHYITEVIYTIYYVDPKLEPETIEGKGIGFSASHIVKDKEILMLEARVVVCGASRFTVPVYVKPYYRDNPEDSDSDIQTSDDRQEY